MPCRHPAATAAKSLLSAVIPGVLEPQRPLATVRLPGKGQAAICAVRTEAAGEDEGDGGALAPAAAGGAASEQEALLAVATAEGILYSYRLELPVGEGFGGGAGSGGGGLKCSLEGEWGLTNR